MPVHACSLDGKPGYSWGNQKCYTYAPGDEAGRKEAKRRAILQGYAAEQHGAEKDATMTDVHVPTTSQGPPAKPKPYGIIKDATEALDAMPDEVLLRPAMVSARVLVSTLAIRARSLPGLTMLSPLRKAAETLAPWLRFTGKNLPGEFALYDLVLRKRPLNGHGPKPAQASADEPFLVLKADSAQQLVTGVVFEPDVIDTQDDYVAADEIEKACHQFATDYRAGKTTLKLLHDKDLADEDAVLVENWVTPQAMTIDGNHVKQGAWIQTWHILNTALWQAVMDGSLTGFSFGGSGERKDAAIEKAVARETTPVEVKVSVERPREDFDFSVIRDEHDRVLGFKGTAGRTVTVEKHGETVTVTEGST